MAEQEKKTKKKLKDFAGPVLFGASIFFNIATIIFYARNPHKLQKSLDEARNKFAQTKERVSEKKLD
jgi:hypothetical protein